MSDRQTTFVADKKETSRCQRTALDERWKFFVRLWAGFGLLLFASTWQLWIPQTDFPQIPLFTWVTNLPVFVTSFAGWLAFATTIVSLLAAILVQTLKRTLFILVAFAASLSVLIILDQHRLQPWAWQYLLFAALLIVGRKQDVFGWMRLIVLSIYVYSALSKLDWQFLHTVGQQFLSEGLRFVGISEESIPDTVRISIVAGFPLGELIVATGLAFPRSRRLFVVPAVLLHLSLLLLLGPFGLDHNTGVLVWNAWFAVQAVLLFGWFGYSARDMPFDSSQTECAALRKRVRTPAIGLIVALAVIFPASEIVDICDHWPAWDLYSPRSSRARILISQSAIEKLPGDLHGYLESTDDDLWLRLRIDRWSLECLSVPIYPEDRYQLAIARAIEEKLQLGRDIRVRLQSDSNRFTGQRREQMLSGDVAIQNAAEEFRLNTRCIEAR